MSLPRRTLLSFGLAIPGCGAQARVWARKRDLPDPRIFALAATIDGKVYAVTSGEDARPGTEIYRYDPDVDRWTRKSHANLVRHGFGAGVLNGRICIWGGVSGSRMVNSSEMYDPATDRWLAMAALPRLRIFAHGAAVNGKLYAVGGILPPGRNQVPWVDEYDPVLDRWTVKADMPAKRDGYRVAAAGNKVYVVGDLSGRAEVLAYDPAANRWTVRAAMPTPRFDFGVLSSGTLIYTFGGIGTATMKLLDASAKAPSGHALAMGDMVDTVEVYDSAANRWIRKRPMPSPNWAQVATRIGEEICVIGGGYPAGRVLSVLYSYYPALDK